MFRRPMLFSGLAMALLAGFRLPTLPTVNHAPASAPRVRMRRGGKGHPGLSRSHQPAAAGFTTHGKRARQRRRASRLQGRG